METLDIKEFLQKAASCLLLDVRSPAEFARGHIPGAVSLPLFTDAERAQVGTLYKQAGKERALEFGLGIVGPNLLQFYQKVKAQANGREVALHCWRGGMRSTNMAHFLAGLGWQISILKDGYKAYRRQVLATLDEVELPIKVLGGHTGSGKTEILLALQARGQQIIDLEGLARHKGSAFGNLADDPQPTQEQFENDLFTQICRLGPNQIVWIEDESARIGARHLPKNIYKMIRKSPVYKIELPTDLRVQRLVSEYKNASDQHILGAIGRVTKRLGGVRTKISREAIANKDYASATRQLLDYYDRTYSYGQKQRDPKTIQTFAYEQFDLNTICSDLIQNSK